MRINDLNFQPPGFEPGDVATMPAVVSSGGEPR
jgi:hypothetical protein